MLAGVLFGLVIVLLYFDLSVRNLTLHALDISSTDSASHYRGTTALTAHPTTEVTTAPAAVVQ